MERHVCRSTPKACTDDHKVIEKHLGGGPNVGSLLDTDSSRADQGTLVEWPFSRFNEPMTTGFSSHTFPKAGHPLLMDPSSMSPRVMGLIPPGVVGEIEQATVEVYFARHPWEISMGPDFVNEMNANVLAVLQHNPQTVDTLSAIGHSYMTESGSESSLAVLNHKARILARLRSTELSSHTLEETVFLLLGLCAIELVDRKSAAPETTIPTLIANASVLISHYVSSGLEVSPLARYFVRALARQDAIISLVNLHRFSIPTSVWLDEQAKTSADRLMGYTATLMPLLEELCAFAEDMRHTLQDQNRHRIADSELHPAHMSSTVDTAYHLGSCAMAVISPPRPTPTSGSAAPFAMYMNRAQSLRRRIELWKPTLPRGLSFRQSRRFLLQANCYRSGALLYLFRLCSSAKMSSEDTWSESQHADGEATAMAHELLVSFVTSPGSGDEAKMLLWPLFLAACEMLAEEDRQMVLDILDTILQQRRTATVQKTKSFVLNRVWPARDEGRDWCWWTLAQQFPGECLPI